MTDVHLHNHDMTYWIWSMHVYDNCH